MPRAKASEVTEDVTMIIIGPDVDGVVIIVPHRAIAVPAVIAEDIAARLLEAAAIVRAREETAAVH